MSYDVEWSRGDGERHLCEGLTPRQMVARIRNALRESSPIIVHSIRNSESHPDLYQKVLLWLGDGEVGLSSKAMAFAAIDMPLPEMTFGEHVAHPRDPDDLRRCLLLCRRIPELENHLDLVAELSPSWARLIENWTTLKKMFERECGLDLQHGRSAPETYDLMQTLID